MIITAAERRALDHASKHGAIAPDHREALKSLHEKLEYARFMASARASTAPTPRAVPFMAYVGELLVDGALMHVLLCGHIRPAINNPETGEPLEFQPCRQCAGADPNQAGTLLVPYRTTCGHGVPSGTASVTTPHHCSACNLWYGNDTVWVPAPPRAMTVGEACGRGATKFSYVAPFDNTPSGAVTVQVVLDNDVHYLVGGRRTWLPDAADFTLPAFDVELPPVGG